MAGLRGLGIVNRPVGTWTPGGKSQFLHLVPAGEFLNRGGSRDRRPREGFITRAKDQDNGLLNRERRMAEISGATSERSPAMSRFLWERQTARNEKKRKEKAEFGEQTGLSQFPSPQICDTFTCLTRLVD